MSRHRAEPSKVDYPAVADRLEKIFETLTSDTAGAQTVSVDYAAFHRAIDYCRHRATKANENTEFMPGEESEVLDLIFRHNQSMDWVYTGNPTGMILSLALGTSSQRPPQLRVV